MNFRFVFFSIFVIYMLFVSKSEQKSLLEINTCDEECICHPTPETNNLQYVVGYGSFIKSSSIKRTDPNAGESIPVIVEGYQRVWNAQGYSIGYSTTYLGIEQRQNSSFNGVIFPLKISNNASEVIKNYDLRERWYCRHKIPIDKLKFLNGQNPIDGGEYWIYVNKPEYASRPIKKYPIVQSYVDIFITGCIEIEEKFNLPGYTSACIKSTEGWNKYWINDRIFPRRPYIYEPKATKIDKILAAELPDLFKEIKIEL